MSAYKELMLAKKAYEEAETEQEKEQALRDIEDAESNIAWECRGE